MTNLSEPELLAAIKAAPDDDAPRRAYARLLSDASHVRGHWTDSMLDAADETLPLAKRQIAQDRAAVFFRDVVALTDLRARADLVNERNEAVSFAGMPPRLGSWTMLLRGTSSEPGDDVLYELVYARGMLAGIDVREGHMRDVSRVATVLARAAVQLFGARVPLLFAYLEANALGDITQLRLHGPVQADDLDRVLALPRLRELDLSDATLVDEPAIRARVGARPGVSLVLPSPATRRCRVSLTYHLVRGGVPSKDKQAKEWFFELPRGRATDEGFRELLNRIFFDANTAMRRREPGDHAHLALDTFTVSPVDAAHMLSWDGTATMASAATFLPWIVAHQRLVWEPAACFVVDEGGRYDGMTGNDFAELVVYRALEEGAVTEAAALAFVQKLYPGSGPAHGQGYFDDRAARLANLLVVRDQPGRRTPDARPCVPRLPHFELEGTRLTLHGPGGSYRWNRTFGNGPIAAHPYGGPGGVWWCELALYVRGEQIIFVCTNVECEYGEVRTDTVYEAIDGGRDYRELAAAGAPRGPDVELIAQVSQKDISP